VFGCSGHGERRVNAGKWFCYNDIAGALAASAGITPPDRTATLSFTSAGQFQRLFPRLARAIEDARARWSAEIHVLDIARVPKAGTSRELGVLAIAVFDVLGGQDGPAAAARLVGLGDLANSLDLVVP
jgi:hypothetical protein